MVYFVVLGMVLATIAGDYFLKLASQGNGGVQSLEFCLGAGLYVLSAVAFLYAIRHMSLAHMGVWYAVLTILFSATLGVVVFREALMARDVAGILMALGALGLMNRFV